MSETALQMRSDVFASMKITAPDTVVAGDMRLIEDTVVVIVEAAASAAEAVGVYSCEKIVLPKAVTSGEVFAVGQKVYYNDTTKKLSNDPSGNTLCGRAIEAAIVTDATVLVDLKGNVAA